MKTIPTLPEPAQWTIGHSRPIESLLKWVNVALLGLFTTVSEAANCDSLEVAPLYSVTESGPFIRVLANPQGSHHGDSYVEFRYHDCEVVAHSDGLIIVYPSDSQLVGEADDWMAVFCPEDTDGDGEIIDRRDK